MSQVIPLASEAISWAVRAAFQIPISAQLPANKAVVENREPIEILETVGVFDVVFVALDPPFKYIVRDVELVATPQAWFQLFNIAFVVDLATALPEPSFTIKSTADPFPLELIE